MRCFPAVSAEYLGDMAAGNTGSPAAAGAAAFGGTAADRGGLATGGGGAAGVAAGVSAGAAAVRAIHSLRKSLYFSSPTVLLAFLAAHSALQVCRWVCALTDAVENAKPAQTAAAQSSPSFVMASPQ